MRPRHRPIRVGFLRLALGTVLAPGAPQQREKPLLSEEIGGALERDGAKPAQRRFDEIYPAQKDRYEIDVKGLAELAAECSASGDQVAAHLICRMTSVITRDTVEETARPTGG